MVRHISRSFTFFSRSRRRGDRSSGFTIVELLIVIVVIAILAAITIVGFNGVQANAEKVKLQSDLRNAATALGILQAEGKDFPANASSLIKSEGTEFQYTGTADSYCLTATSSTRDVGAFHISSDNTTINEGPCTGHQGSGGPIALTCPTGFIVVPGNSHYGTVDFCVMKYEAKNDGSGTPVSTAAGLPWVSISQTSAISASQQACSGCHLITEAEWMTIAMNALSVPANWSGGAVGSGGLYKGHTDQSPNASLAAASDTDPYSGTGNSSGEQKRTLQLTNGEEIWDLSGNIWEWTQGTIASGKPGASWQTGFLWAEYNNSAVEWASLPSQSRPTGTLYGADANVGQLFTNYNDTTTVGFLRGGRWTDGQYAGIWALELDFPPSSSNTAIGFRVAK